LKNDGAAVETSGAFEVVTLTLVVGNRGFPVPEGAASSADSNGFGGAKLDKEAANGLGEATGVVFFSVVAVGLGKVKGEVAGGVPAFTPVSAGLGKANGDAGAPAFSAVSAGLGNAIKGAVDTATG
jgi:hypothetical protein